MSGALPNPTMQMKRIVSEIQGIIKGHGNRAKDLACPRQNTPLGRSNLSGNYAKYIVPMAINYRAPCLLKWKAYNI